MLWSCSFIGSPQPQTKLLPMAYAMFALPILGAFAPSAHTAVSCLCVCCAHFLSTGLMFRPTGGWWIGFQKQWFTGGRWIGFSIFSGSLVDDVGVASLVLCRSRNFDILLVSRRTDFDRKAFPVVPFLRFADCFTQNTIINRIILLRIWLEF